MTTHLPKGRNCHGVRGPLSPAEISIADFCIALYCACTRFDAVEPDAAGNLTFSARKADRDELGT